MMSTGERIEQLARERGMSLHKLATLAGVSYSTLYSAAKRKSDRVDRKIVEKVAAALGVEIRTVFSDNQFLTDYAERALQKYPNVDTIDAIIHVCSHRMNLDGRIALMDSAYKLSQNPDYQLSEEELEEERSTWLTSKK